MRLFINQTTARHLSGQQQTGCPWHKRCQEGNTFFSCEEKKPDKTLNEWTYLINWLPGFHCIENSLQVRMCSVQGQDDIRTHTHIHTHTRTHTGMWAEVFISGPAQMFLSLPWELTGRGLATKQRTLENNRKELVRNTLYLTPWARHCRLDRNKSAWTL